MQLDRILMPTDFSDCAEAALDHAIFLAQQFEAELHLLYVVELFGEPPREPQAAFPGIDEIYARLEEIGTSEIGRLLSDRQTAKLNIREAQCRAIAAAPAIVEYAAEEDIDLIVLGTHGRRGLRRFLLGSVAEEVVRTADCPVMTVRRDEAARHIESIDRIVVPFDFSADAVRALETAKELAAAYGSRVDVVHVIAPPMAPGGLTGMPLPGVAATDLSATLAEALARRVDQAAGPDVPVETHVLEGSVAWRIADFVREVSANLVVLGRHGFSGLHRFLLGSVSERVVRLAHCPVLVLRHPDEAELSNGTGNSVAMAS